MSREQGSALVVVLAAVSALSLVIGVLALVAHRATDEARAQSIADLSALAAAYELHNGSGDPCELARETAAHNAGGKAQVACVIHTSTVEVTVTLRAANARAVAGPAS